MTTQITVKQHIFKAVSYAMGLKDIRYYLNGLFIEHNGAQTRITGCDGCRVHSAIVDHPGAMVIDPVSVIVPRMLVETIIKAKGQRKAAAEITLTIDGPAGAVKIAALLPDGTEAVAAAVDGKYPDYRRTLPTMGFSGEAASYNPDYLVDAHAGLLAWLEIGRGSTHGYGFRQNGPNGVGGYALPGFVALVMPLRLSDEGCQQIDPRFLVDMQTPETVGDMVKTA